MLETCENSIAVYVQKKKKNLPVTLCSSHKTQMSVTFATKEGAIMSCSCLGGGHVKQVQGNGGLLSPYELKQM